MVLQLVESIGKALHQAGAETAHLKVMGQTLNDAAVANLVSSQSPAELSMASEIKTLQADLLVNARVATDPDLLTKLVEEQVQDLATKLGLEMKVDGVQSFRPAPPEPTHRAE